MAPSQGALPAVHRGRRRGSFYVAIASVGVIVVLALFFPRVAHLASSGLHASFEDPVPSSQVVLGDGVDVEGRDEAEEGASGASGDGGDGGAGLMDAFSPERVAAVAKLMSAAGKDYCAGAPAPWLPMAREGTDGKMRVGRGTTYERGRRGTSSTNRARGATTWEHEREDGANGRSSIPWRCAKDVALPRAGRKTGAKISRRRSLLGLMAGGSCRVRACYRREAPPGPKDAAEADLVACLGSDAGCPVEDLTRWAAVGRAAAALPSMRMLRHPPRCFTVTAPGGGCASVTGNVETGRGDDTRGPNARDQGGVWPYPKHARPPKDLPMGQMGRCALVGNAPFLKRAKSGRAIDAHETVWRYNLKGATIAGGAGATAYAGKKTTVRMFNRLRARQLSAGPSSIRRGASSVAAEDWIFWYASSPAFFPEIRRSFPTSRLRQMAPSSVNYVVEVYAQLARDLTDLGMGPFKCPTSLTSGIHSVVVAPHLCAGAVSVFGFSYSASQAKGKAIGYSGHTWALDVLVYRLLHLAGFVNVCATDPLISA